MIEYTRLDSDELADDSVTYLIRSGVILDWIHIQPDDMWHYSGVNFEPAGGLKYTFTSKMEAWFKLRWS
jgi:hypothetical protein